MYKIEDQFCDVLFTISQAFKGEENWVAETKNLTLHQLQTLIFIKQKKQIKMADIAENFNITMPTATSIINKLVELKMVEREYPEIDRRVVEVRLSKKAEEIISSAIEQRKKRISQMLSLISKKEQLELLRIMKHLSEELEKKHGKK